MAVKLKDILAISGQPGLFKFIKQGRNGIIVESFETKKRMNAYATTKMSSLEDITVYTDDEDKELSEVMQSIYEKHEGKPSIDPKKSTNEELKKYFAEILPEYDQDRVYVSDIKKIILWYNLLQRLNAIEFEEKKEEKKEETKDEDAKKDEEKVAKQEKSPIKQPVKTKKEINPVKKAPSTISKAPSQKATKKPTKT